MDFDKIRPILVLSFYASCCVFQNGGVDGSISPPEDPLKTDGSQGACPNHFAEFFHQISLRNQRTSAKEINSDGDHQAWLSTSFQIFELSALLQGLNQTMGNETKVDTPPTPKFECKPDPEALNGSGSVILVNSSELVRLVSQRPNASSSENATADAEETETSSDKPKQSSDDVCVVVMFYDSSCQFSAATAPEFNALGRGLTGVDVLAFDINQSNGINSRYGIVAVPSIILFHNGKLAARFNESQRTLDNLTGFIHNLTGLPVNTSVTVSAEDREGPVPTTAVVGPDYFLWFSNVFLFLCGLSFLQQKVGAAVRARVTAIRDYVVQVWRTGEFYEQVGIADNEQELPAQDIAEIR